MLVELAVGLLFLAVGAAAAHVIAAGALLVLVHTMHQSGLRQRVAQQNGVQNGLQQNRAKPCTMHQNGL